MDRQLKQRLVCASVVVALAVIFVPEFVKQQPPSGEAISPGLIPPQPEMAIQGQTATIVLPNGASLQQPEMIGSDQATGAIVPGSNMPENTAAIEEIVMPPGSNEALNPTAVVAEATGAAERDDDLEPRPEPVAKPAPVSKPVQVATPKPQAAAPEKPAVTTRKPPPEPAPKPVAKPTPAPVASVPQPKPNPPAAQPKPELPPIQLIARSQHTNGATQPSSQQVSRQPRWMVQAGSFYVAQNASLLREKLRQQRFPTQLQTAEVEGRTVYRVQVGPHATRAEGERTQVRLLREAGINGSLVPIYN